MKNARRILGATVAALALAAGPVLANAAPQVESTVSVPTTAEQNEITQLPQETADQLFTPDSIVLMDSKTGEVIKEIKPPAVASRAIKQLGPGCGTNSLCLHRPSTTWGFGFEGAGTMSGNWTGVNKYGSKKYANQIWWKSGGKTVTGGKRPAGQLVLMDGTLTVNKVKIF